MNDAMRRAFAEGVSEEAAREVYLSCAPLELENAAFLESVLGEGAESEGGP